MDKNRRIGRPRSEKFQEALDRLLQVDADKMFSGIHKMNSILEDRKITHPMEPQTLLELGMTIGAIVVMQNEARKEPL